MNTSGGEEEGEHTFADGEMHCQERVVVRDDQPLKCEQNVITAV